MIAIECQVWFEPEVDGGYSVSMPCLPGVCSQGDTMEEATANITEAFQGVAEYYFSTGDRKIPWLKRGELGEPRAGTIEKYIV